MKPSLIREVHQAVLGIPGTEDNGLVGDLKEIKDLVREQNKRIRKNEQKISKIWGILIGVGVLGGSGLGVGISQLLGS